MSGPFSLAQQCLSTCDFSSNYACSCVYQRSACACLLGAIDNWGGLPVRSTCATKPLTPIRRFVTAGYSISSEANRAWSGSNSGEPSYQGRAKPSLTRGVEHQRPPRFTSQRPQLPPLEPASQWSRNPGKQSAPSRLTSHRTSLVMCPDTFVKTVAFKPSSGDEASHSGSAVLSQQIQPQAHLTAWYQLVQYNLCRESLEGTS